MRPTVANSVRRWYVAGVEWSVELSVTETRSGDLWKAEATRDLGDGWKVHVVFVEQDGAPVVGELHLLPTGNTPPGGLTTRRLRSVNFKALLADVRALAQAELESDDTGTVEPFIDWLRKDLRKRPGRRGRSDLDYARLAAAYEQVFMAGSTRPVFDLGKQLKLSRARVRDLLHEARRRGLLSSTGPGQGGGTLTEKAKALLEAERKTDAPATHARPGARHQGGKP